MEEAIFMRNMVQDALRKNVKHYPEKKKKTQAKKVWGLCSSGHLAI
jgi:hypothetical protein